MTELDEALSPHTSPERLLTLAASALPEVQSAVAQNPSTPTVALLGLAAKAPVGFLQNPVLPLLLLERPDLASHIPPSGLVALLQHEPPEWLLSGAAQHAEAYVREAAAKHSLLPELREYRAVETSARS